MLSSKRRMWRQRARYNYDINPVYLRWVTTSELKRQPIPQGNANMPFMMAWIFYASHLSDFVIQLNWTASLNHKIYAFLNI